MGLPGLFRERCLSSNVIQLAFYILSQQRLIKKEHSPLITSFEKQTSSKSANSVNYDIPIETSGLRPQQLPRSCAFRSTSATVASSFTVTMAQRPLGK